jgi:hypothetical protein
MAMFGELVEVFTKIREKYLVYKIYRTGGPFDIR